MTLGRLVIALAISCSAAGVHAECMKVPAPSDLITSVFGWRFHPVYKRWRLHQGVDFRASSGTPLVAANSGVVQVAHSSSGGNEVRIVGDDGVVTRYLHLTKSEVSPGARVSAGQEIALSGGTGEASAAPHLHFEVHPGGGKQVVNPESMLCQQVPHKSGADVSDGFPVQACDPNGGQCSSSTTAGGSSTPPAGSAGSTGGSGTGGSSSSGGNGQSGQGSSTSQNAGAPVPTPPVSQFDDMSVNEIIESEVMKRFANPDWYTQTASRGSIPLLQDFLHMLALDTYLGNQKALIRGRMEALLAAKLARENRLDMATRLARQREAAAKAGQ
ncbi:M23 family metallopeptidase [Burkholderia cenocepacia]|uniref:M23 family metallopeptidase n=1 Tax=Burkholderia cenocepacia TaxID=95486 RepID=UPI0009B566E1|nr:M23 family metallopeptidase [Burkholderia cenocepacia]